MGELASSAQLRMALVRRALVTVPSIFVLGFLSGAIANPGGLNPWYSMLRKASFQPPPWVFPVAWSTLYVLLGIALAIILNARGAEDRGRAIGLFAAQFILNLAWSPVFFAMHQARIGLAIIAAMLVLSALTTWAFWHIRRNAGLLMLPYLAWLCLASVLNFEVVRLNPDAEHLVVPSSTTQIEIRR